MGSFTDEGNTILYIDDGTTQVRKRLDISGNKSIELFACGVEHQACHATV